MERPRLGNFYFKGIKKTEEEELTGKLGLAKQTIVTENTRRNSDEVIKKYFGDKALAVFVKPPSIDELKIRLKKRSTESEDKINMRIAKASVELATAPQFDTIIKNYDLDVAKVDAYNLVKEFVNK